MFLIVTPSFYVYSVLVFLFWVLFFFRFLFYSHVHTMFGSFLPPFPTPCLTPSTTHSPPLPSRYQAETILPLSLILLKREYKQ
jgi:hypothetical protein